MTAVGVLVASQLGRPKGGPDPKYSLLPVAKKLEELIGRPVRFSSDCVGPVPESKSKSLADGGILLHFPEFRDARRLSCSLLLNGKFLNTVVKGVHDKEVAVTVEGQPVWGKEFTRFGPFRSEAAQVLALGGEPLNATAYRADPDPVVLVDT